MTDRLYYTDAHTLHFDARLVARADDGRTAWLDRTAFYPTSGGQPHDTGTLAGVAVVDVVDEDDRIAHRLAAPLAAAVGDRVTGAIDAGRRRDHMQQHTGQHLLSAVFLETFGYATVSVHFGAETCTLDLAVPQLAPGAAAEAERRANALVAEDRPVSVTFEDAATAEGLRRPSSRGGTLRIVTIDGVDRSACGGTHVATTGAIGPVLVRRVEKVKQGTRVEFACGARAVARSRAEWEALRAVGDVLRGGVGDVAARAAAQVEAVRVAKGEAERLRRALVEALVAGIPADGPSARAQVVLDAAPIHDGLLGDPVSVRLLASALVATGRAHSALVTGTPDGAATPIAVAMAAGSGDARVVLRAAIAAAGGGRGGGSVELAQGAVADGAAARTVLSGGLG